MTPPSIATKLTWNSIMPSEIIVTFLPHILPKKQNATFSTSRTRRQLNHSVLNIDDQACSPLMTVTPATQHMRMVISNTNASLVDDMKLYVFRTTTANSLLAGCDMLLSNIVFNITIAVR